MRQKAPYLAVVALLLAATGCSSLQTTLNIEEPRYTMRDIRPHVSIALPLSASSIDFDMNVEVENPNSVGLRLDRIDFDLMVNGSRLLSGVTRDQIRVPARGTGEVRLTARVGYNQIRSAFREVSDAIQGNRAKYELRGRAYYDTPIGRMDFPFTVYRTDL
jgi:LEA14-like dessication related protein